ncbi:hypothetical protein IQ06DRAFT_306760 [Phaeosphaeriaceae sp. SRC1lsM3a]|nr:hypothetical protein IQ06DRAFT_306760 [Stagonospora sp. SRC1lsM3a]
MTVANNLYGDLVIERALKDTIIEQAKASFNLQYPFNLIWSVVVDQSPFSIGYKAYVVVYKNGTDLSCLDVVLSTPEGNEYDTPKAALVALLECARFSVLTKH